MLIRKAVPADLGDLLAIYNDEVVNGTATLDIRPRTEEEWLAWFRRHNVANHPLYVALDGGRVAAYACLSGYREKEAYDPTVELSVYVARPCRGRGIGEWTLAFLLDAARRDERIHNVVSVITEGNEASVRLHEKFGFAFCGRLPEAAFKKGRQIAILTYSLLV